MERATEDEHLRKDFMRSAPGMMETVFRYLDTVYGGAEGEEGEDGVLGYLNSIGFGEKDRERLRKKMVRE